MHKDINSLSGIEFENLCQVLLQKGGFDVETTKTSGDGGIDLIARNQQPFFSGKYIIQCKRYIGSVGEPVVRDLYGVVMAERANKGILLTTGRFTISAIRFSEDKNIELIDGNQLAQLLSKYELVNDHRSSEYDHFTRHECFDSRKYEFYRNKISQNEFSIEMGRHFLFGFLFDYMKIAGKNKKNNAMLRAGFGEEYIKLFDCYAGKYYKRGKEDLAALPNYIRKYKGLAQLLNYDLLDYVQERYNVLTSECPMKINVRAKTELDAETLKMIKKGGKGATEKMKELVESGRVKLSYPEQDKNFYELMNLLGVFSYFKIESGIRAINKILFGKHPHFKVWIERQKDYESAINNVKIFYFNDDFWSEISGTVNLTSYYDQSAESYREKIQYEITQIDDLITALY